MFQPTSSKLSLDAGGSHGGILPQATFDFSPLTKIPLSSSISIHGERVDFGSDWHLPRDPVVIKRATDTIINRKTSDLFICLGDVIDASDGSDTTRWTEIFLRSLAHSFGNVLYIPGNHCLRSRANPWESFDLPSNVVMPYGENSVFFSTPHNTFLLGNAFYDLEFIDPTTVDITTNQLKEFYFSLPDGRFLLGGGDHFDSFKRMAINISSSLSPDVTVLLTHTLPHPSEVSFKVKEYLPGYKHPAEKIGAQIICTPEEDEREALQYNQLPDEARAWWNKKSFFMGSNILNRKPENCRDGLIVMYGHNHRPPSTPIITLENGSNVKLVSHQPFGGDGGEAWKSL
jgi:hypothetical protein